MEKGRNGRRGLGGRWKKLIITTIFQSRNNKWALCQDGYFLQGLYRSSDVRLHNIEQALCCKPRKFSNIDMARDCYDEDVRISLDTRGWSKCKEDWYYMVGVYKEGCDDLHCIEMIRCCKMRLPGTHSEILFHQNKPKLCISSLQSHRIAFLCCYIFLDMPVLGHWLLNGQDELLRLVIINQSINQSIDRSIDRSIDLSINQSVKQITNQSINHSNKQPTI